MTTITVTQLTEKLTNLKGTTMATITTETVVKMSKKNNPYANTNITKKSRMNVTLGFNYTNSVINQRIKEGIEEEFVAHPRKWGNRIKGTPLVHHINADGVEKFYLEAKMNGKPQSVEYFSNGVVFDVELIKEFLPKVSKSSVQGTEKEIIMRDFELANIKEVKMFGEIFEIL